MKPTPEQSKAILDAVFTPLDAAKSAPACITPSRATGRERKPMAELKCHGCGMEIEFGVGDGPHYCGFCEADRRSAAHRASLKAQPGSAPATGSPRERAASIIKDILVNHLPRVKEGLEKGYVDENQILVIYDHAVRARILTEHAENND